MKDPKSVHVLRGSPVRFGTQSPVREEGLPRDELGIQGNRPNLAMLYCCLETGSQAIERRVISEMSPEKDMSLQGFLMERRKHLEKLDQRQEELYKNGGMYIYSC